MLCASCYVCSQSVQVGPEPQGPGGHVCPAVLLAGPNVSVLLIRYHLGASY